MIYNYRNLRVRNQIMKKIGNLVRKYRLLKQKKKVYACAWIGNKSHIIFGDQKHPQKTT